MHKTIVSDTSCFIILAKISELNLLFRTYGQIITTKEVALEYGEALPDWVIIKEALDKDFQHNLEKKIDKGEASAIALAIETDDCTIILDDYKARQVAEQLGLDITGTIGVIIKAKLSGIIPSIIPYLEKISKTDFRITEDIKEQALKEAGE
jgi:predicted nucleic acid-binding protein